MKTFAMYCLVFFVLIAGQSAFAQTSPALKDCKTLEDSLQYLRKEFVESGRFVGKPAGILFDAYKSLLPVTRAVFLKPDSSMGLGYFGRCPPVSQC